MTIQSQKALKKEQKLKKNYLKRKVRFKKMNLKSKSETSKL